MVTNGDEYTFPRLQKLKTWTWPTAQVYDAWVNILLQNADDNEQVEPGQSPQPLIRDDDDDN